jgi:hypothetical protein
LRREVVLRWDVSQAGRLHRFIYADYVGVEQTSSTKYEFSDGEIYAMAGGTEEHSALAAEVLRVLGNAVGERPCRVHSSDLRVFVEARGLATFPDGSVVCGPLEKHPPGPETTALNPSILIEVTSDSSEAILVSHRERRITVHARVADGTFRTSSAGTGDVSACPASDVNSSSTTSTVAARSRPEGRLYSATQLPSS